MSSDKTDCWLAGHHHLSCLSLLGLFCGINSSNFVNHISLCFLFCSNVVLCNAAWKWSVVCVVWWHELPGCCSDAETDRQTVLDVVKLSGIETVTAEFAHVHCQLYVIIVCYSVTSDPCQQVDGQGSRRRICVVRSTLTLALFFCWYQLDWLRSFAAFCTSQDIVSDITHNVSVGR